MASNPSLSIIRSLPDLPLEKLSFKSCNVTKVEAAAFKKLVYLAYLDLSHNSLDTLEKAMFEGPHRFDMISSLNNVNKNYFKTFLFQGQ